MPGYPTTYGALYTDLYDPPFPASPLGVAVELFLGAWTDITPDVYERAPIGIRRGRPDESSTVQASSCSLTLNNRGNNYTVNNPTGAYYGLLNRNTPLRVSVPNSVLPAPHNATYLRMEDDGFSYASCPAAARIELTGSLDVRVDVAPSGYGSLLFASVWQASAGVDQRCWKFGLLNTGQLFLRYSTDGTFTNSTLASSEVRLPISVGRQCLRVTLDAATGNIAFYTAGAGNVAVGPWTQIGSTIAGSGATSVFASASAALAVGYSAGVDYDGSSARSLNGAVHDMELRSGIGGTVVAKPAFNAQGAGAASWTDAPGNAWSVTGTAVLANRSYRYHGELTATPKAADPSARDVYSQATASGILRRLQQANTPLNSPMYRAYVRATGNSMPVAYWPCEDGTASTQIASGLPSGTSMQISGTAQLASSTTAVSSAPLPVLNGSIWRAPVPQGGTWTYNSMQLIVAVPASPSSETANEVVASLFTNGTVARFDLTYNPGGTGSFGIDGYNSAGTLLFSGAGHVPADAVVNGSYMLVNFGMEPSGGGTGWTAGYYAPSAPIPNGYGAATGGVTIGPVTSIAINTFGQCQQLAVGHVGVFQHATDGGLVESFNAWGGETAANRIQRLCTEEGVAVRIVGHTELSLQMGAQTIDTLPALLQACETTDRGMLFEPRTCLGIGYRTPFSMYNQTPAATVSYTGAQLDAAFASTCDDLMTINDVTVSNTDGSSARRVLASGPLSIQPPPYGVSRIDTGIQVDALSDGYLPHIAQWILHVATDYHDRFPDIPFNLARTETPLSVALLDIGALLAITSPPVWLQPDEIDQLCAGFTESLGPLGVWQIEVNGIPAYPYTIAQCAGAGGNAVRADTDGSQTTSTVSATAGTLSVATVAPYPLWTTSAGDFPFDIDVAGERMTVTNITGASSPQSFTVTRSVNGVVKVQPAGAAVALWYTPICGQLTGA